MEIPQELLDLAKLATADYDEFWSVYLTGEDRDLTMEYCDDLDTLVVRDGQVYQLIRDYQTGVFRVEYFSDYDSL